MNVDTPRIRAPQRKLCVLVVDDHDVVHWGFRVLLGGQPWVERCLAARTGEEALELTRNFKPDVALVDLFLHGESGADVCESIRAVSPATRVLLISGAGRMSSAAARAAGASGFVSKDMEAHEVADAVRAVGMGMTLFAPKADQPAPLLSEREREVLGLIAAGSTNREIAQRLYLSPHTVKEHSSALYRKLGARNRADAVQRAQRVGLLDQALAGYRSPPMRADSVIAVGTVAAPRERVFALLRDLDQHWRLADRWVAVVDLDGPRGRRAGGRLRLRGPLGLRRLVSSQILLVVAPAAILGIAHAGARTAARVDWRLREHRGVTEVMLSVQVIEAGVVDGLLLALGGRWWLRRRLRETLERLAAWF